MSRAEWAFQLTQGSHLDGWQIGPSDLQELHRQMGMEAKDAEEVKAPHREGLNFPFPFICQVEKD
eukprot:scaffold59711_cov15-Prasinocladus_malaysianus.AAC.1